MCRWEVLLHSYYLAGLGLLVLVAHIVLAHIYWFRVPFIGISLATLFYVAGLVGAFART